MINSKKNPNRHFVYALVLALVSSPFSKGFSLGQTSPTGSHAVPAPTENLTEMTPGPAPGAATPDQLQELVSPFALYPDRLVALILAGSTYPAQLAEAAKWVAENPSLKGDALAAQVNVKAWDPSIKSLTQFPQVLKTMNDSLAWTSALGEAYYNQPGDVMEAIQVMRNRAVDAGTLKSNEHQKVEVKPAAQPAPGTAGAVQQTVIVQPAQPETVYVPQYNPTTAYGAPVQAPAGYTGEEMLMTGVMTFGAGILLGALINEGDDDWDCDWEDGGGSVTHNNNVYVSNGSDLPSKYPSRGRPGGAGGVGRPVRPGGVGGVGNPGGVGGVGGIGRPGGVGGPGRPGGVGANRTGLLPSTRPYNAKTAQPYRQGLSKTSMPEFPGNASARAGSGIAGRALGGGPGSGRGAAGSTRQSQPRLGSARAGEAARGFGGGPGSTGGRSGAFGGYQSGGRAQVSSRRGRASLAGRGGAGGRGGGGGRRGGGGGRRGGGGGGRNR